MGFSRRPAGDWDTGEPGSATPLLLAGRGGLAACAPPWPSHWRCAHHQVGRNTCQTPGRGTAPPGSPLRSWPLCPGGYTSSPGPRGASFQISSPKALQNGYALGPPILAWVQFNRTSMGVLVKHHRWKVPGRLQGQSLGVPAPPDFTCHSQRLSLRHSPAL